MSTALQFTVPPDQSLLLAALPEAVRVETLRKLDAMESIAKAPSVLVGAREQSALNAGRRGWAVKNLERLYADYRESGGDWKCLVDRSQAGVNWWARVPEKLPAAFIEHWQQLCAQNTRDKVRAAWTALVNQWQRWRHGDGSARVPGYEACPAPTPQTDLPHGWTYNNLMRHAPTQFTRRLIQIGPKAAASMRPFVITTRAGLSVAEYYMIDDFWHDFKVNVPGARQASRLLQFHVLDLLSACNVERGFKPALDNEITGVQERLKECEMLYLLAHLLTTTGYRAQGTTIICEAGTATVREREIQLLHDLTGGKIKVECGPTDNRAAFAGLFPGRSGGNPRFKAALESHGNLLHNRMADTIQFPGQTGSNSRLDLPESLSGRDTHNRALLLALAALPADAADKLRLDFLSYPEAIALVNQVTHLVNCRTDHELEGWRACGHFVMEWRPTTSIDFLPLEALNKLPEDERQALSVYIRNTPNLTRERALSPHEVFASARKSLVRIPAHLAALLLNDLPGHEITVRNNMIELMVPEVNPDESILYEPLLRDGNGIAERLQQDSKWLVRVNPLQPGTLYIYRGNGGFAGTCARWDRVSRADTDALHRAFGRAAHAEAQLVATAKSAGRQITQERLAATQNNSAVLQEHLAQTGQAAPATPEQKRQARQTLELTNAAEAALDREADL